MASRGSKDARLFPQTVAFEQIILTSRSDTDMHGAASTALGASLHIGGR